ncbi:hypothetical protein HK102_002096 [Quaeritorhiza haematococci]|nr:hypothetical protein HK102_002096 [Quaeritorhiza haematococci]
MMQQEPPLTSTTPAARVSMQYAMLHRRFQKVLDDTTPYPIYRWAATAFLCLVYFLRVFTVQGWYIVTYALGIYLLNLFLAFLTPKFDPALEEDTLLDNQDTATGANGDEGPSLPMKNDDEFRPFIRRLPEFKFWYAATRAFVIAFICTLFKFLDIPVFWPILLLYFLVLFGLTMKRQIRHMIKYKYMPWDYGKKRYSGSGGAKLSK